MPRSYLPVLFIFLLLAACRVPEYSLTVAEKKSRYYTIQGGAADSSIARMLAPYKTGVDTQMKIVIGRTDIPLTKAQPECTIGNFMADAQLNAARRMDESVEAAIVNYGGIRLPYIAPGALTRGTMYELMPFENLVVIVDIPGEVLKQFCNHMARGKGWPVANMRYKIKDAEATDIMIDGKPFDEERTYKIALSDYIAKGGDNCGFLVPLKRRFTSLLVRDAMIAYVQQLEQQGKPLHPQIEKRIEHAE